MEDFINSINKLSELEVLTLIALTKRAIHDCEMEHHFAGILRNEELKKELQSKYEKDYKVLTERFKLLIKRREELKDGR